MADELSFSVDSDWKKQAQEEKRRLAEEAQQQKAPARPTASETARPGAAPARRRRRREELPAPSFSALVQTLASQALLYLGGVPLSSGEGIVDLDMAKHQIDLLAVLEEKSRGNLSEEEQKTLDITLYETRMRYVGVASRYIL